MLQDIKNREYSLTANNAVIAEAILVVSYSRCRYYSDLAGEENAKAYKTLIFLAGSASAEFFADIGLCPFEAVKVLHFFHSQLKLFCPFKSLGLHRYRSLYMHLKLA